MRQLGLENHAAESVRFGWHHSAGSVQAMDRSETYVLRIHWILSEELEGHACAIEPSAEGTYTFRHRRREEYGFDNISFKREEHAIYDYLVVRNLCDKLEELWTDWSSEEYSEKNHVIVC